MQQNDFIFLVKLKLEKIFNDFYAFISLIKMILDQGFRLALMCWTFTSINNDSFHFFLLLPFTMLSINYFYLGYLFNYKTIFKTFSVPIYFICMNELRDNLNNIIVEQDICSKMAITLNCWFKNLHIILECRN